MRTPLLILSSLLVVIAVAAGLLLSQQEPVAAPEPVATAEPAETEAPAVSEGPTEVDPTGAPAPAEPTTEPTTEPTVSPEQIREDPAAYVTYGEPVTYQVDLSIEDVDHQAVVELLGALDNVSAAQPDRANVDLYARATCVCYAGLLEQAIFAQDRGLTVIQPRDEITAFELRETTENSFTAFTISTNGGTDVINAQGEVIETFEPGAVQRAEITVERVGGTWKYAQVAIL